jgi:Ca2+-binding EF-hand superfamily protein
MGPLPSAVAPGQAASAAAASGSPLSETERWNLRVRLQQVSSRGRERGISVEAFERLMCIPDLDFSRRLFKLIDADSSGMITVDEAMSAFELMAERADLESRVQFCFRLYDADNNGGINRKEFAKIIALGLTDLGTKETPVATLKKRVDAAFEKIDMNGDQRISYPEFLRAAEEDPTITDFIGAALKRLVAPTD